MKTIAFVLVGLFVGTLAGPTSSAILGTATAEQVATNERIVTGQIIQMIEDMSRQIREAGLDPWEVNRSGEYELPVAVLFSASALVEDLVAKGLSNIVVQSMNFSLLQSRLTFNIVLPELSMSIGNVEAKATVFGEKYDGAASGSLNINTIRLIGDVRINISIIGGISVRSLSLTFSLGGIQSKLNIEVFGKDLSSLVNTFLGTTVPGQLNEFSREINQLLEIIASQVINDALNRSFF